MHVIRIHSAPELEVMAILVNHSPDMANIERIVQDWSPAGTMCDAGYKNDGFFQQYSGPKTCPNTVMYDSDGYPEWYCSQERHHQLRVQLRNLQYRQPMLNFYWKSMDETVAELRRQLEEERRVREETERLQGEAEWRLQPNTLLRLLDRCHESLSQAIRVEMDATLTTQGGAADPVN